MKSRGVAFRCLGLSSCRFETERCKRDNSLNELGFPGIHAGGAPCARSDFRLNEAEAWANPGTPKSNSWT